MSRIGIKPIVLPDGVQAVLSHTEAVITGPQGELRVALPHGIKVNQKENRLTVSRVSDVKLYKSLHGTIRSLLSNAAEGVAKGFEKRLELVGIGYRAAVEDQELVLQVGYTHSVRLAIPEGLTAKVEKNVIIVAGRDKHQVGQFAANIRAVRKPEPYKGKGIRYQGEKIRMKQGKAMKTGAA